MFFNKFMVGMINGIPKKDAFLCFLMFFNVKNNEFLKYMHVKIIKFTKM